MILYGTNPSHFTRKVRILLQEYGISYTFVELNNLLEANLENFAQIPLLQFPILEDNGKKLIESDLIALYLMETYGKNKEINTLYRQIETKVDDLQFLAYTNGAMAAGVKIIRATRSGITDLEKYPFFQQELLAIQATLDWLEERTQLTSAFTYLDLSLVCLLQWALFRKLIPNLEKHPRLMAFLKTWENRPSVLSTHPEL
ncbi:MAG: glutathione S-transferase family protein [Oligoflexia bacterium]|nr:glutathione S-transferase family protein [Oligoflexia bacterium]